ncbi:hypothetical protein [Salinimicrobium oceani]|uniref:CarboxypepD_reg-like domain-containing protein n=1 Tax=Salinimicrobium oceani TaxID=2722702 RepID=A0ABX1CWZ6_9FLAO|nr:hypothetical protein [Salinimicrobium oceani]NJW51884.1 hypothetical protein [Salinimicrobium oceani]
MKKLLLLLLLLCCSTGHHVWSQERLDITGTIIVPVQYNSSGIHVYNFSSGKGNVSDAGGNFELRVKEGDSVYFTALQFKELLVVVDDEIIQNRRLVVEISVGINELPEVVVRSHELTGRLEVDAGNIETVDVELPTMTAMSINDYEWEFRQDGQSRVTNSAMGGSGLSKGANPLAILSTVASLLLPRTRKKPQQQEQPRSKIGLIQLERKIRARYSDEFFLEQFKITPPKIADFIAFLEEQNFSEALLNKEREMDLLQMMFVQSEKFLKLQKENSTEEGL